MLKSKTLNINDTVQINNIKFIVYREAMSSFVKPFDIFMHLTEIKNFCVNENYTKISILVPILTNIPFFIFYEMTKFIFKSATINVTLYKQKVINIEDQNMKLDIIKNNHESLLSGHPGIKRTLNRILGNNYYWKNMRKDVINFVNA